MDNKQIYIFKNAEYRFRLNCILIMAIGCPIAFIIGHCLSFQTIVLCIFVFAIYFIAKNYFKKKLYYSTITVDNCNQKLIFQTVDGQSEIFDYKNIDRIEYDRCMTQEKNSIYTNIRIYNKSNSVSYIELSDDEFSHKFLYKLPPYIKIVHTQNTTTLWTKIF